MHTASPCILGPTSGTYVRTTSPIWPRLLRARHRGIEFNIEGNPFAGARDNGYPGFDALIDSARPHQCTLVPDGDDQLTSDHGWDLSGDTARLVECDRALSELAARA